MPYHIHIVFPSVYAHATCATPFPYARQNTTYRQMRLPAVLSRVVLVRAPCMFHLRVTQTAFMCHLFYCYASLSHHVHLRLSCDYVTKKCLCLHAVTACALQVTSKQSTAWPPMPGILLEPKAHVRCGDFDKMVLMQVCLDCNSMHMHFADAAACNAYACASWGLSPDGPHAGLL